MIFDGRSALCTTIKFNTTIRLHVQHISLQWRHNERDGVSNHHSHDSLLNRVFKRRSKKTSKLRVTGLCAGNLPVTGEFPAQRASNTENVSIWWRHQLGRIRYSQMIFHKKHSSNSSIYSVISGNCERFITIFTVILWIIKQYFDNV